MSVSGLGSYSVRCLRRFAKQQNSNHEFYFHATGNVSNIRMHSRLYYVYHWYRLKRNDEGKRDFHIRY